MLFTPTSFPWLFFVSCYTNFLLHGLHGLLLNLLNTYCHHIGWKYIATCAPLALDLFFFDTT